MRFGISVVKVAAALAAAGIVLTVAAGDADAKKRYCRKEYCAKYKITCGTLTVCRPTSCLLKGVKVVEC